METLVLGARGGLGRLVVTELAARGHRTRTVSRREARDVDALAAAAKGVGAIVDCAGASIAMGFGHGWRGYRAVDTPLGLVAAAAARRVAARMVYVGVHHAPELADYAYVDAHERVVAAMRACDGVVVRATGFYSAFGALVPLARRGILVDAGSGRARTNPIDEHDLAAIVAEAVTGDGPREFSVGGPEVLTRAELFERIAAVAGRRVRIVRVPAWLAGAGSAMLRVVHPRIGQFAKFAVGLSRHDNIAPALGTTTLADYLGAAARLAA
jgi:uncharacterized protein YbjT (DUF2867 family)